MAILSKQALKVENNTSFPNNSIGAITATGLRDYNTNIIDSMVDENTFTPFSASVLVSINSLNAFTASQQPSFTALNAFTASQTSTNNTVNGRLNTAEADITVLEADYTTLANWSASINQIIFDNVVIGNAQRFAFGGNNVTASIVPNVAGQVAVITVNPDATKLNTSSFNAYTASTAATQSVFSASVANSISASLNAFTIFSGSQRDFNNSATASLVQLLNFSSSLSGGFATQGELDASASALQANIDTKVFTSSFNAYTQSTNNTIATLTLTSSFTAYTSSTNSRLNSIESTTASLEIRYSNLEIRTGSYATTGSNNIYGAQNISGSLTLTGSVYANVISASVVSSTASLDFSKANFFSVILPASASTFINIQNPSAGQTALVEINTAGAAATASFSINVYQPDASYYVPTNTAGSDILTFTSFTNTKTYLASVKTMTNNY